MSDDTTPPPADLGSLLVELWEAANEYHMARGGGVLTAERFEAVPVAAGLLPPPTEGTADE